MKILRSILLTILGFCLILCGSDVLNMNIGHAELRQNYGGDAYTGIQNAECTTGQLIILQSDIISYGLGCIMIFGGITMIVFAIPTELKRKED